MNKIIINKNLLKPYWAHGGLGIIQIKFSQDFLIEFQLVFLLCINVIFPVDGINYYVEFHSFVASLCNTNHMFNSVIGLVSSKIGVSVSVTQSDFQPAEHLTAGWLLTLLRLIFINFG
jgi:hypothetical protein